MPNPDYLFCISLSLDTVSDCWTLPSIMICSFLFYSWVLPLALGNPLQPNLLTTPNISSLASGRRFSSNATGLTTYNDCFDSSSGHDIITTKSDCEKALDTLVDGKSLVELHSFGYEGRGITDRLPVEAEYGTCSIAFLTFDMHTRITLTYAEIYAELLGPDGLLKGCLGPHVPAGEALGGQTSMGPSNLLVVDVTGQPIRSADHKDR